MTLTIQGYQASLTGCLQSLSTAIARQSHTSPGLRRPECLQCSRLLFLQMMVILTTLSPQTVAIPTDLIPS